MFEQRKNGEKGGILVMLALSLLVLTGISALAIDLGRAYIFRREMQNVADLAALAGLKALALSKGPRYSSMSGAMIPGTVPLSDSEIRYRVHSAVRIIGNGNGNTVSFFPFPEDHTTSNSATGINFTTPDDVEIGIYNPTGLPQFTPQASATAAGVNAVRVTVQMGRPGSALTQTKLFNWTFGKLLGADAGGTAWSTQSIAVFGKRHFVIALDVSGSMDDNSHPVYAPNPTALGNCPSAVAPYAAVPNPGDGYSHRNFRFAPFAANTTANGITNCMGGRPQPAYGIFDMARTFLQDANNKLFDQFYRVGLITFGTFVEPRVPLDADDNRVAVANFIQTNALDYWEAYRLAENPGQFVVAGGQIFPGGDNPMGEPNGAGRPTTGFTNIGSTLVNARAMLNAASVALNVQTVNAIILLTDGVPNCDSTGFCSNDAATIDLAKSFDIQQRELAKAEKILIFAIYYNVDGGTCTGDAGYIHLQQLVSGTGGEAFCTNNAAEVLTAFNRIALRPPFVLVNPE